MTTRPARMAAVYACAFAFVASAGQPGSATLRVGGELPRSSQFTAADLEKIGAQDVVWSHEGKTRRFRGLPLHALLAHLGFEPGPMGKDVPVPEKCPGFRKVVIASAPDGFQALFTAAELWPALGKTQAFLVWSEDGQPLSKEQGPFRLVVVTDQLGARNVHRLEKLQVMDPTR